MFYNAMLNAKALGLASKGDVMVITGGATGGSSGKTSVLIFETVR